MNSDGEEDHYEEGTDDDERRKDHLQKMADIEDEFTILKNRLYEERLGLLNKEIQELETEGKHALYDKAKEDLKEQKKQRILVAELTKKFRMESVNAQNNFNKRLAENELEYKKSQLMKYMLSNLEEKRRQLEQERIESMVQVHLIDNRSFKKAKKHKTEKDTSKRRKLQVEWPFVVYQLKDSEIMEDISFLRRLAKQSNKKQQVHG